MNATVSRTWWVAAAPLDDVELEYFAEQTEEWGNQHMRVSIRNGRIAFNTDAAEFFATTGHTFAYVQPLAGGGYELRAPSGTVPLRKVVKSRDARSGETPGEL